MNRSNASRTSCGSVPVIALILTRRANLGKLVRQHDVPIVSLADDLGLDRLHLAAAGGLKGLTRVREPDQRLEVLDRGEDQGQFARAVAVEGRLGLKPAGVDGLRAVGPGRGVGGRG